MMNYAKRGAALLLAGATLLLAGATLLALGTALLATGAAASAALLTGSTLLTLVVVTLNGTALLGELEALGLPGWVDASRPVVRVTDTLTGDSYEWSGQNYVRLDPFAGQVAHVFSVEPL